jgi:phosphopantothenoylcysteine decarboxylase/phosphopantothenate--cysteine ligase
VICGPTHLTQPVGVRWVPVVSAQDMYGAVKERFEQCDVFIAASAVSDYRPKDRLKGKYKKGPKSIQLELVKTTDILEAMGKRKQDGQTLVGYSLEVDDPVAHGMEKLKKKRCDLMVVNTPGHFGDASEHVWIIDSRGVVAELPPSGKDVVAAKVIELAARMRAGDDLTLVRTLEDE